MPQKDYATRNKAPKREHYEQPLLPFRTVLCGLYSINIDKMFVVIRLPTWRAKE